MRASALLLAFLFVIPALFAANLLQNPGFEDGLDYWTRYSWRGSSGTPSVYVTDAVIQAESHSGGNAYLASDDRSDEWVARCQAVTVQTGQTYVGKVWVKVLSGKGSFWLTTADPGHGLGDCSQAFDGVISTQSWTQYTLSCTPRHSTLYFCIGSGSLAHTGSTVFDDASLELSAGGSATPTPASCSGYTSCSSCTPRSGCGWSASQGACKPGTSSGSTDGTSSGSDWKWISSQCSTSPTPYSTPRITPTPTPHFTPYPTPTPTPTLLDACCNFPLFAVLVLLLACFKARA